MSRILPSDRALIVGKTRSGKSTLGLYLLARFAPQRVAIDPKAEWRMRGAFVARSPVVLETALHQHGLIAYVPSTMEPDEWEAVYSVLFNHGRRRRRGLVVLTHEAAEVSSASWRPRGLRLLQTQGAGLGIGHLVCTQRPRHIARELITEAEHIFVFPPPLKDPRDLKDVAEVMSLTADELRARLLALPRFSFLWWDDRAGELTTVEGGLPDELRAQAAAIARSVL